MAIEEPEQPGRRVVYAPTRRGVRLAVLSSAEAVFGGQDLSQDIIREIAFRARLITNRRGDVCFGSDMGRLFLLERGCVREDFPDGMARLWGPGALIGDWTGAKDSQTRVTVLSDDSAALVIAPVDIAQLTAVHGPGLAYALGRMSMRRLHAAETVYGANRLPPLSRVAKLLLFLANHFGYYDTRRRDGQRVTTIATQGSVEGPSQADFADALGISRASVENAIAALRDRGVLQKRRPEERRTNRRYVIMDREELAQV
ncbi:Crp/Fnr family transcriptional regulator, partial [Streptomyces sp. NPDC060027]|uniref:Crp/Fnr family transcriptional regulator n=1 Tax=Streptomyces sp. NPDC060027 TaxID=3347040 RepID=UPI0036CAF798